MNRKHILTLTGCILCMSFILAALYGSSSLSKEIYRGNFERNFVETVYTEDEVIELPYNSYYIAGFTSDNIYLGNWTGPFHMMIINIHSLDTQHVTLKIKDTEKITNYEKFKLKVEPPHFYLTNGSMPALYKGRLETFEASRFMQDSAYFEEAVPISPTSFALRSYSLKSKGYELAKEKVDSPYFEFNYDILEKQIDGLFCVHGMLHYSKELNRVVYLYSYRNQYMVMDSGMNLLYRANTIDTIKHAHIKVAHIKAENSNMLASPPAIVNSKSCVFGNYLFVKSNLLAKNGDEGTFRNSATIDVYDLTSGSYSFSFHLPNYEKKTLSDFAVYKGYLTAISNKYLILYKTRSDTGRPSS